MLSLVGAGLVLPSARAAAHSNPNQPGDGHVGRRAGVTADRVRAALQAK